MSHKTRKQRQVEAIVRNEEWAALSLSTKLARLHGRPGMSLRQRDRLMTPVKKRIDRKAAERAA